MADEAVLDKLDVELSAVDELATTDDSDELDASDDTAEDVDATGATELVVALLFELGVSLPPHAPSVKLMAIRVASLRPLRFRRLKGITIVFSVGCRFTR
ncbi:MAG TPA: hypothetical protein VIC26_01765 [Marinagarivorans sp.]